MWACNIQAQLSKMRELYNAVPDKTEWLTEQDLERYEREMVGLEPMGSYAGFPIRLLRTWGGSVNLQLCGKCTYQTDMGESELGNITRIENLAQRMNERKED